MINPFSSYNLWVRVLLGEPETWHAWAEWEARPHDTETKWTERSQVAATDISETEKYEQMEAAGPYAGMPNMVRPWKERQMIFSTGQINVFLYQPFLC